MPEICHILSRGVDKRKLFMDNEDYLRFIHDLFEFNDVAPVDNVLYRFLKSKSMVIARPYIEIEKKPRKLLVNIHAFCLMPNHYHLLLSARFERGISKFMKKLNMGYSRYFNERYTRRGTLFESRYKSIVIKDDAHFINLPFYIHLNPLDLKFPEWRDRKLKDYKRAIKFLDGYRWSSHMDYLSKKNFPSVTQRELLMKFFDGPVGYKSSFTQWLKDITIEDIEDVILE